jgi:UrcA family protein
MTKLMFAAAAAALMMVQPAAAQATSVNAEGFRTTTVRYGDLNLDSQAGADALMSRIERAVKKVCAVEGVARFAMSREVKQCQRTATEKAVAQVNAPSVWAAFEARSERRG